MNNVHCYTLEVSFYASTDMHGRNHPLTCDDYRELGKNLAMSFLDYYKEDQKAVLT